MGEDLTSKEKTGRVLRKCKLKEALGDTGGMRSTEHAGVTSPETTRYADGSDARPESIEGDRPCSQTTAH